MVTAKYEKYMSEFTRIHGRGKAIAQIKKDGFMIVSGSIL
jgi:hypothetical protein